MPSLSVVLTGRNDDHGKGFADRLIQTARVNADRLARAGVDAQFLFVEWNPPADRPLLSPRFVAEVQGARARIVPPAVHEQYCQNPRLVFMEFFAKNAGIRAAQADWILTTNADILLSAACVARIGELADPTAPLIGRALRRDLAPGVPWDQAEDSAKWTFSHVTTPPFHAEGAGDFILASRHSFEALRGFNEVIRFAKLHKDTQFCHHAVLLGWRCEVLGDVHHLHHERSWVHLSLAERVAADAPWGPPYDYRANLPYLNPPDWGLQSHACQSESERIEEILPRTSPIPDAERLAIDTNPIVEARRAWRAAQERNEDPFVPEYVAGLGRWLRTRADDSHAAVAVLRRYVLEVWRRLADEPACRERGIALYGAGRHTRWLLDVLRRTEQPVIRWILDDAVAPGQSIESIPIVRPESIDPTSLGAIVLSSDTRETQMANRCQELFGDRVTVVRLHDGLPAGIFLRDSQFRAG